MLHGNSNCNQHRGKRDVAEDETEEAQADEVEI